MGRDLKFDNLLLIAIIVIVLYYLLSGCLCNNVKENFKDATKHDTDPIDAIRESLKNSLLSLIKLLGKLDEQTNPDIDEIKQLITVLPILYKHLQDKHIVYDPNYLKKLTNEVNEVTHRLESLKSK